MMNPAEAAEVCRSAHQVGHSLPLLPCPCCNQDMQLIQYRPGVWLVHSPRSASCVLCTDTAGHFHGHSPARVASDWNRYVEAVNALLRADGT